jgi:flagellar biosynthesis protein FlhG
MQCNGLDTIEMHEIKRACSYLFLRESIKDDTFIKTLTLDMVKKAYRKNAREHHPDLNSNRPEKDSTEKFIMIQRSYELLTSYFEEKIMVTPGMECNKKRIVAVGGAKGGIGKSIFATNLGVYLSSKGYKTVLIDLDLGNANMHLYLGKRALLKRTVNDFLRKRVDTLEEIMVKSEHGPFFIGGDSSELGAANIDFMKKLKLIRAIKNIDASFIILDLGGDTSYNILDFFLQADYGIVLTTREAASYIGAYHFIKAALYRKLNRLFGPESPFRDERNSDLERLVQELTHSSEGVKVKTIEQLVENLKEEQPFNLSPVMRAISDFNPYLVVNKVPDGLNVNEVVMKIQDVSKRWLSKEVRYLGNISTQFEIEKSALDLIPVIARYPKGKLAAEISHIAKKLFDFK